jgi:hypothetical protein
METKTEAENERYERFVQARDNKHLTQIERTEGNIKYIVVFDEVSGEIFNGIYVAADRFVLDVPTRAEVKKLNKELRRRMQERGIGFITENAWEIKIATEEEWRKRFGGAEDED